MSLKKINALLNKMINTVQASNFRCFENLSLDLSEGLNLFVGNNGSGKTSILEIIYLLGRGKSFRTSRLSEVILKNTEEAILFLHGNTNQHQLKIGAMVKNSALTIKVNSSLLKKRSDLLDVVSLQILTPLSHELVDKGPVFRRKYLDWGLFHVEHVYRQHWSNFQRILKQRNQLLKTATKPLSVWDDALNEKTLLITELRQKYLEELIPFFYLTQEKLFGQQICTVELYPGWNQENSYLDELNKYQSRDIKKGWTSVGVHNADLRFKFDQINKNSLSRGQQKILVYALHLAQCLHLRKTTGHQAILLMDDLTSELDDTHTENLIRFIQQEGFQTLITSTERNKIPGKYISKMFHVEHSGVKQLNLPA